MPIKFPITIFLVALTTIWCRYCRAQSANINWSGPTVFSLTVSNTQSFQPYLSVSMLNYTGQTHVYFLADAGIQNTGQWQVAFDDYGGSVTQKDISWPGSLADVSPYIMAAPGWFPPGISNVHQHWEGTIGHVYQITDVYYEDGQPFRLAVGAPLKFMANAAPTVQLLRNGFWSPGQATVLTAMGDDAEADLWNTAYLEYRWDFDSDGVWDTDWSHSNQITNTFVTAGAIKTTVQVIDRGYADNGWQSDVSGETWADILTNFVLSANSSSQLPSLSITKIFGGLDIAWLTNEVPYRLLENATLDPFSWLPNTNPITVISGTNRIWVSSPTVSSFYRLVFP